jgi:hypothetical protein
LRSEPTGRVEGVVWSGLVNATAAGNSLSKTAGCDGCADAGAVSRQQISVGDGFFEFTASETDTARVIGLNPQSASQTEFLFALRLRPGGFVEVRENGVLRTNSKYVRGDVFRIAIVAGVVRYSKNGRLLYISGLTPAYPLVGAAALMSSGATVTNATISGRLSQATVLPVDAPRVTMSVSVPLTISLGSGIVTKYASATFDPSVLMSNGLSAGGSALHREQRYQSTSEIVAGVRLLSQDLLHANRLEGVGRI